MITGEHAVVYGKPAIVCAIDQRIFVTATTLKARIAEVHSTISEPLTMDLNAIHIDGPMKFVLAVVAHYADQMAHGIRLNITSQINPTMGLGSSAAVTAASLAAVHGLTHGSDQLVPTELHQTGLGIIRHLQGRGSGADLAASLHGGMLAYQLLSDSESKAEIRSLPAPPPLSLCYAGYKTPTADVLARIATAREGNKQHYDALYKQMGVCAAATINAAQCTDWSLFANHLQEYQRLMEALGVSDNTLSHLINQACSHPETMAAKISGSGLGDCVVALGHVPTGFTAVTVASDGLRFDE